MCSERAPNFEVFKHDYNTTFKLSNLRTLELDSLFRTPAPSTSEFDRLSKLEVRRFDRLEFESSTGV